MTDLSLLEKYYPDLVRELGNNIPTPHSPLPIPHEIEQTASGLPVLKINGLYIHSPRDPIRESQRQVQTLIPQQTDKPADTENPIIILGFGLGYTAEAAALEAPGRPIIIVEKHKELLRLAFEQRDLVPLLINNRIVFVLNEYDGIYDALSYFKSAEKPVIIKNRNLISLDESWYDNVEKAIYSWKSRTDVNRATLKRFGMRWVKNLSSNLKAIHDMPGILQLKNILKDTTIPVFLAAAGPSLDKTGSLIPEIAKRCVIIAVDTSLRFILRAGIEPDFTVSVDPQYWNFRHLDRAFAPKSYLITESAVYPPCLRHPFKGVFLCGSVFPLGRFIEDRVDPKGAIGTGGSVATTAWDFARLLGASSVWIAGLDLGFPELKTHFKGALFEEKSHAESSRFAPAETWSLRALRDGNHFLAKNANGNPVLTDQRLSLYASWFENHFNIYPEIKNFSLSGEGLAINGMEIASELQLLALPERRDEINFILDKIFGKINDELGQKKDSVHEKFEKAVETLLDGLKDIKDTAEQAADLAGIWGKRFKDGHFQAGDEEKVLKKLDKANQTITGSAAKEVAGFLFPDLDELEKNLDKNLSNPLLRHLEYSKNFYCAVTQAAEYNLKFLSKNLEKSHLGFERFH